jgi:hypothetical protein
LHATQIGGGASARSYAESSSRTASDQAGPILISCPRARNSLVVAADNRCSTTSAPGRAVRGQVVGRGDAAEGSLDLWTSGERGQIDLGNVDLRQPEMSVEIGGPSHLISPPSWRNAAVQIEGKHLSNRLAN